jgi:hypothetical protein
VKFNRTGWLVLILLAAVSLTACSSSSQAGDQDPKDIKVELATEPAQARAGEATKLLATVTGLVNAKDGIVQFEIRKAGNKSLPELIEEVEHSGDGLYSASFTFKEPASYDVYIHIYSGELHITKKKPVEVME